MAYALVHDVPASWERYDAVERLFRRAPHGLLVHVAGPKDEGFRIVDVWANEAAWRAFEPDFGPRWARSIPRLAQRRWSATCSPFMRSWAFVGFPSVYRKRDSEEVADDCEDWRDVAATRGLHPHDYLSESPR